MAQSSIDNLDAAAAAKLDDKLLQAALAASMKDAKGSSPSEPFSGGPPSFEAASSAPLSRKLPLLARSGHAASAGPPPPPPPDASEDAQLQRALELSRRDAAPPPPPPPPPSFAAALSAAPPPGPPPPGPPPPSFAAAMAMPPPPAFAAAASAPTPTQVEASLAQLATMGFSREVALDALRKSDYKVEAAANLLIG